MAATHKDSHFKMVQLSPSLAEKMTTKGDVWYHGYIYTPHGIVAVLWSEPRGTLLRLVHNGLVYERQWRRQFQPRYLVTLAKRFAADIVDSAGAEE